MPGNYGPSGVLFTNERKQAENHPDYEGKLELDDALVRVLLDQLKAGDVPTLELKGWKKVSKTGKKFLSLSPKQPWKGNGASSGGGSSRRSAADDPF